MSLLLRYKPLLKKTRGTPEYALVRALCQELMRSRHLEKLLHAQNKRLYEAARERDRLLYVQRGKT